ncbi:MAG: hypothetical protein ACQEW8_03370 [Actinomycetota bacterium]
MNATVTTPRVRRVRIGLVSALLVALMAGGGGAAHAFWSAQSTHTGTSTAGLSLPAPASTSCQNQSLLLVAVARVSWAAVPGATGYRVVITRASGGTPVVVNQTATAINLSSGVLGDLLTGLLAPTTLTVRIFPTYSSGSSGLWVSPNSRAHTANAAVLPIGTTCGTAVP